MVWQKEPISKKYTLEEYLAFEETALEKHEFINGKIICMPGGTGPHAIIAANMVAALKYTLKKKEQRYIVLGGEMKIHIPAKKSIRYPDAVVICEQLDYLEGRKDVIVNPLAIVEVLSDSTRQFDKTGKFDLYQRIPSFKEYILVEQDYPEVTTFFREKTNVWHTDEVKNMKGTIHLKSLGIDISLEDIYDCIDFE